MVETSKERTFEEKHFQCIVKAFGRNLSDPVKRRAYDSTDPQFDRIYP